MAGWVYVITNKAMPNIVKVGFSMKDPELRAKELYHTGTPHTYTVNYHVLVVNPFEVEQLVHGILSDSIEGKEWFRCSVEEAIAVIKEVIAKQRPIETFKKASALRSEEIKQQRELARKNKRAKEIRHLKNIKVYNMKNEQIVRKYQQHISEVLPADYKVYYAISYIASAILISILFSNAKIGGILLGSILLAFIIATVTHEYAESKAIKSEKYSLLIKSREEEVKKLRIEMAEISDMD